MRPFEYSARQDLKEILALLGDAGEEAKVLAGGQSLLVLMRQGLVAPRFLVSLRRVDALKAIEKLDSGLRLGSMVTYRAAAESPEVRATAPVLSKAAGSVGSIHIRNLGTVGGSLCHADPAGDVPTTLLALDAELNASSLEGSTSHSIQDFFTGLFQTRLKQTQVLESIVVPPQPAGATFGYQRFLYREGEYPLAVAACRLEWDDGMCTGARVAVGGGDAYPKRLSAIEEALTGSRPSDSAVRQEVMDALPPLLNPIPDIRGSAAWKTKVVAHLVSHAIEGAVRRKEAVTDA